MIDLQKVLKRQEIYNKNPLDLSNVLSRLAIMKRSIYYYTITSAVDSFLFCDGMLIDRVKMEYEMHGKYEHQRDIKIVDIHTNIEKIAKLKVMNFDSSRVELKSACELYGEIVQESLEEMQALSPFKIKTHWHVSHGSPYDYDSQGQCLLTFHVVKE